ncbi:MAG: hypothetical protein IJS37_03950 [Bacilli bacterium]|nr:hypothetical protein [Bacilli bacterium]
MRTLIIYQSKTGNTEKYAKDIAKAVNADVIPFKKFKEKMIKDYDTIVFGGRVIGNRIQKIDEFLRHYEAMEGKNVILFSVGMSIVTKETRLNMISSNLLDMYHVRYYQLRGSFDYAKLGGLEKFMFANSLRLISRDPNATADQKMLLEIKDHPIEFYDNAGVEKIITVLNKLSVPEA